jgi:hypothetical protein
VLVVSLVGNTKPTLSGLSVAWVGEVVPSPSQDTTLLEVCCAMLVRSSTRASSFADVHIPGRVGQIGVNKSRSAKC